MTGGGDRAAPRCVGALLAGGGSTRFGSPKGLAMLDGARLVDRVAAALRAASDALLVVANDAGARGWLPGVPCTADRLAGGPLAGIHAALDEARAPVLVLAWDMPRPSASLLRELRAVGEHAGPDCLGVVPIGPHGPEPLCAWYAPALRDEIAAMLARGERRAQSVAALPGVVTLGVDAVARHGDPARLFANVNTMADLERAARDFPDEG